MDDVKKRLEESTANCIKSYEAWSAKQTDLKARETLQEAVHELRKVASRLEIEMVVSERKKSANEPLPIPPHRSSSKGSGATESILPDNGNTSSDSGAGGKKSNNSGGGSRRGGRGRRPSAKKSAGS
ncbi:MAG: hypothetical protein MRY79_04405 [Alphaproteobacteria bacterium]|nr:hypothetical protein [Alphaproteobacteria bacterium]